VLVVDCVGFEEIENHVFVGVWGCLMYFDFFGVGVDGDFGFLYLVYD